jgi:phage shock protein E
MKQVISLGVLFLWGLSGAAAGQHHPPVEKGAPQTAATKLYQELAKGGRILVIDVRTPKEYSEAHIPEAINIPIDELPKKLEEMKVSRDTTIVTMCDHGGRSSRAALELQKLGYKTSSFCKIDSWRKQGYKIEKGAGKPQAENRVHPFVCHHYCNGDKETTDLDQICECACVRPYRECMEGE